MNSQYNLVDELAELPEDHSSMGEPTAPNQDEIDPSGIFDSYREENTLYLGDGEHVYAVRKRDVAGEEIMFAEGLGTLRSSDYDEIVSKRGFDQVVGYLESDSLAHFTEDGFARSQAEEPENPDFGWRTKSSDATISRAINK